MKWQRHTGQTTKGNRQGIAVQNPPWIVNKDCNPYNSVRNSPLYDISGKEFRVERLKMFNELKETMVQTASKIRGSSRNEKTKQK